MTAAGDTTRDPGPVAACPGVNGLVAILARLDALEVPTAMLRSHLTLHGWHLTRLPAVTAPTALEQAAHLIEGVNSIVELEIRLDDGPIGARG